MKDKRTGLLLFLATLVVLVVTFGFASAISPSGATVTPGNPETAPADSAGSDAAYAGNITGITLNGYSTTQAWQGYYGNVTGTIQLADADDDIFYNWTLADPQGEVYASTNNSITWTNIQCFNFTAGGGFSDESGNGGTTNEDGVNLTNLENLFNIAATDVDGVNETFALQDHDAFTTANQDFSADECLSTRVFTDTGPVDQQFEEALLYEPVTGSIVFASILESGATGYHGAANDFQMMVLEDGHGSNTTATTYYFFVELE